MFRQNLETMIQNVAPGSIEYANLHCELFAADEVKRLMLEADKREQVVTLDAPIAEKVACHIQFEMEIIGEVDETLQEHHLAGPEYNPDMTPTETYIRWVAQNWNHWHRGRGPEPMLDQP